jgi:hypothetical protein
MPIKSLIVFAVLILCIVPLQLSHRAAAAAHSAQTVWFFLVVETHVTQKGVEPDNDHPEERRWYISNITALPENVADYSAKKKALEYFDANIVAAAAKHGIAVDYNDDEAGINGGSVLAAKSQAEAEEMRNKDIADRKEQGGNIYSFNLVFGPAKGEETSQPKLLYRDKAQPNYEGKK